MEMVKVKVLKDARLNGMILSPGVETEIPVNLLEAWVNGGFVSVVMEGGGEPPKGEGEPPKDDGGGEPPKDDGGGKPKQAPKKPTGTAAKK